MRLLIKLKKTIKKLARTLYSSLPLPGIQKPVFIIGCGRSGTTILGAALSRHKDVVYLNEPRHLWHAAFPETDIWTTDPSTRNAGRLTMTAIDARPYKSEKLRRLFRFETIAFKQKILIEKLPINNFRLNFILQVFPDARFIHICRNGLEVARSIAKANENYQWFGLQSYKWVKLAEHAKQEPITEKLPSLCTSDYEKGLLEWRLSVEAAEKFLSHFPQSRYVEVNYADFVSQPVETIAKILDFIDLPADTNVDEFAAKAVARKSSSLKSKILSEKEQLLGGKLLPLSMESGQALIRKES